MAEIHLNADTLRLLALFEALTGAPARDVLEEEDRYIFVVEQGQIGRAIGKGGINLNRVRDKLQKDVDLVEHATTPEDFMKSLFHRFKVQSIEIHERKDGEKVAKIKIDPADKGKAIGRGGRNVQLVRTLADRHHGLKDVILE